MQVVLNDSYYNAKDIHLIEGNKSLNIMFAGTGDLHWLLRNEDVQKNDEYTYDTFEITKENYQVYYLFATLMDDIKNINLFNKNNWEFPLYIETEEEKIAYIEEQEEYKQRFKKFNLAHYNDLYDEETDSVTWVSDETGFEVANLVRISKVEDNFLLEFITRSHIDGYEKEQNYLGMIGIRFCNSGSRYDPFNVIFMRMFQQLQYIDDVKDFGHQLHIEEYLYNEGTVKKLVQ